LPTSLVELSLLEQSVFIDRAEEIRQSIANSLADEILALSVEQALFAVNVVLVLNEKRRACRKFASNGSRVGNGGRCSFSLMPIAAPKNFSTAVTGRVFVNAVGGGTAMFDPRSI